MFMLEAEDLRELLVVSFEEMEGPQGLVCRASVIVLPS